MDFLKALYNDSLDIEGDVVVAGLPFKRSRILLELEPNEYEQAFYEWRQERQQTLLNKTEEILGKFDNADRFDRLKAAYRAGSVIPFVGAGMSIPSGYPGWTAFLRQLREESHVAAADLETHLANGQYEEAAQRLFDDAPSLFNEALVNAFSRERTIAGSVQYLPHLFDETILTTNFDSVLKRLYDNAGRSFDMEMFGDDSEEFAELLGRGKRILVRLHGHCERRTHRVLTKAEYDTAYGNPSVTAHLIQDVIFKKTLLFLGCSLTCDRLQSLMADYVRASRGGDLVTHFAFVELRDGEDRVTRKRQLADTNIFPIWYPEGEHDDSIEALLLKLAEDVVKL